MGYTSTTTLMVMETRDKSAVTTEEIDISSLVLISGIFVINPGRGMQSIITTDFVLRLKNHFKSLS